MTIDELLVYGKKYIHKDQAKLLLADLTDKNPLELLNYLDEEVSKEKEEDYKKMVKALKEGMPIQYVIGNVNFYGNTFYVNENVLIPRFETEELVENTIEYIKRLFNKDIKIIDLGCGSGNIGITIKKLLPTSYVDLIDISDKALETAKKNANNLEVDVHIYKSDFFENVTDKYNVIISNPPYIKDNEEIEDIVKNNEPELALFAGSDGMDSYRKIFKSIKNHLDDKFLIALEMGKDQKDDMEKLINETFSNVSYEFKKDLSDRYRMVFIFNE